MAKNPVKKFYALGHAKWYDPCKKVWTFLFAAKAERELRTFLRKQVDKNKTLLELGCGTGENLETIFTLHLAFKSYLCLDFSPEMLKIAKSKSKNRSNVTFRRADITNLKRIKKKYDLIICTWVLSHLKQPAKVVNQAQKLLKPNGKMFLIFFTEPKGYIKCWMDIFAGPIFQTTYVSDKEIKKFNKVKTIHQYGGNVTTTVEIRKK